MKMQALVWSVYIPSFLLAFGTGLLIPTLPIYALSLHLSYEVVSLVVAAASLGTLLFDVPAGVIVGRLGRRWTMIGGTGALVITSLGLGISSAVTLLILFRLLSGMGSALWGISRLTYIAEEIPRSERGRALASFGGVQRIGTFAGPVVGGLVAQFVGLNAPFFLYAAVAFIATLLAVFFVPEGKANPTRASHSFQLSVLGEILRTQWRELTTAGAGQIFAQMIRAGRQILVPLYANAVIGLDVGAVGTIVGASAAIDMTLFYPAGLLMDRFGRRAAIIPSFIFLGLGMGAVAFTHSYIALLGAVMLVGFGNGLGSGSMMTLGSDLAPRERTSEFLGIWRLIGDAGSTGGPVIVGAVADAVGLGPAALVLCGFGLLSAALFSTIVRETHQVRRAQA